MSVVDIENPPGLPSSVDGPRPVKLAHIVMRTPDIKPFSDWYKTVLNASAAYESLDTHPKLCFLTYDEEHHRLAIFEDDKVQTRAAGYHGPLDHVAFTYASIEDLITTYKRLARLGIKPFWPIHHGSTISIYYLDPDGNRVELQYDTMSTEEAIDFTASAEFRDNPIGVIFDPDELVSRVENKEDIAAIHQRPPLPEGLTPMDMLR